MEEIEAKYKCHIFVCVNDREQGPCCAKRDSEQVFMTLRNHINQNSLMGKYNVSRSKCLGHCNDGPTLAIYPDGKIFRKVALSDTKQIIEKFLS